MSGDPTFLIFAVACGLQILIAAFLLVSRINIGRVLRSLGWFAFALQFGALAFAWNEWATSGQQGVAWSAAWIDEVSLGFAIDYLGLAMISLGALFVGLVMIGCPGLNEGANQGRAFGAIVLAHASVVVAWLSSTSWAGIVALSLSLLSVVLFRSVRWSSEDEAVVSTRDAWERAGSLLFLIFGSAIMSVSHGTAAGTVLATIGLLLAFQPFPLLGAVSSHRELPPLSGLVVSRLFPAMCSFGIFLKLEPQLRTLESIQAVGFAALVISALAWLCGLFQNNWRSSLSAYISGCMPVAVALLVSGMAREATLYGVGVFCGIFALAASGAAIDTGGTQSGSNRKRAVWVKVLAACAAIMSIGLFGSAAGAGLIPWIDSAQSDPELLSLRSVVLFFGALLVWKIFWQQASSRMSTEASWIRTILPVVPLLASFALFWTGDPFGGTLPGSEAIFSGPLASLAVPHGENGLLVVCGLLVVALLVSFWTDSKEDRWQRVSKSFPRMSRFISGGYGTDAVAGALVSAFHLVGSKSQSWLDEKVWNQWLPDSSDWTVRHMSRGVDIAIAKGTQALDAGPRKATDVSAKLLQLVHNGDVQWYLLLALGCGAAILLHFLNLTGAA